FSSDRTSWNGAGSSAATAATWNIKRSVDSLKKPTHGLVHGRVSIARYRTRAVGRVKAPKPNLLKPTAPATAPPATETTGGQKRHIRARIAAEASTVAPPARSTASIIS